MQMFAFGQACDCDFWAAYLKLYSSVSPGRRLVFLLFVVSKSLRAARRAAGSPGIDYRLSTHTEIETHTVEKILIAFNDLAENSWSPAFRVHALQQARTC